jgi:capsular exopolysaccharide synthesis family protein
MSYLFDALQRLDEEQRRTNGVVETSAVELLARAEQLVRAQKDTASAAPDESVEAETERRKAASGSFKVGAEEEHADRVFLAATEKKQPDFFGRIQKQETTETDDSRIVNHSDAGIPAAEAFRLLSVRLHGVRRKRKLKNLLITSTVPQEGKSMVSGNLACHLHAGAGERILLLEGDVRRPTLLRQFGVTQKLTGLCNYLHGDCKLVDCIYYHESKGIWMLPAGDAAGNLLELLQSPRLAALLQDLDAWFDWIVIDSPPALPLADTSVWARLADGILLVARQGVTEKKKLLKGVDSLDPHKLIGAILNFSSSIADPDYYYYRRTETPSTATHSTD